MADDPMDTPKLPTQKKAEYDGREVTLYDPFRIEDDEKKFAVYVEDPDSGNVRKVKFGSDSMSIKRDQPDNLKNFRSRFSCGDVGQDQKHTALFWSCAFWRKDKSVTDILDESVESRIALQEYRILMEEATVADVVKARQTELVTPQSPQYSGLQRILDNELSEFEKDSYNFFFVDSTEYDRFGPLQVWGGMAETEGNQIKKGAIGAETKVEQLL